RVVPPVRSKIREPVWSISRSTHAGPSEEGGVTVGRRTRRRTAIETSHATVLVARFAVRASQGREARRLAASDYRGLQTNHTWLLSHPRDQLNGLKCRV